MKSVLLFSLLFSFTVLASPDWSNQATLPESGHRHNIYDLDDETLKTWVKRGRLHSLIYPVDISGVTFPYRPLKNFLEADESNPIKRWIQRIGKKQLGFNSMEGMYQWLGLTEYPKEEGVGAYYVPFPNGKRPKDYMGVTVLETKDGPAMTFSCAACHTQSLFGRPIIGLTNKRPNANDYFLIGKKYVPLLPHQLFKLGANPTDGELRMYKQVRKNIKAIGAISPQNLGLDTSLAQVALSFAHRVPDAYATRSRRYETFPRYNELEDMVADSKPAVWWNLKYKTRWLADGSIVSGNPVFTNILWNEIGRGTDMRVLKKWMQDNEQKMKELTAAIFATEAPKWKDYFGMKGIKLERAKRGERIYMGRCAKCHGRYTKAWSTPNGNLLPPEDQIETIKVHYHKKTPVELVNTDPNRYLAMKAFAEDLNRLNISKWGETKVEPQEGYVPNPLVGIWARYPYLHNNSIPTLCDLLLPGHLRTPSFYQGPSEDPETDFDSECVGYPTGNKIPREWRKEKKALVDTSKPGLSNRGHDRMLRDRDGNYLNKKERLDLIHYLKTL